MRRALRAGESDASTVTMVQIRVLIITGVMEYEIMMVETMLPTSMPTGKVSNAPMRENTTPTVMDSTSSIRTREPLRAPRVRSRASSRMRWPTSTAKVLEITKDETSRARAAKAPRTTLMEVKTVEILFW